MLKYLDEREDWIDLPVGDLDSFNDKIEMARASTRGNLKVIQLKLNELAVTPQDGANHCLTKRSRISPSPSPKFTGILHVAKKPKSLPGAKCLEF